MSLELWLAFALASSALLAVPGPTVMIVVSYALGRGRSSAWATVPAVALGDLTAMTISLLGAGAILAASATLFTVVKIVGAVYLVWLGIQLWRSPPSLDAVTAKRVDANSGQMFWELLCRHDIQSQGNCLLHCVCTAVHRSERPTARAIHYPDSHLCNPGGCECRYLGPARERDARTFSASIDASPGQSNWRQLPNRCWPAYRIGPSLDLIKSASNRATSASPTIS